MTKISFLWPLSSLLILLSAVCSIYQIGKGGDAVVWCAASFIVYGIVYEFQTKANFTKSNIACCAATIAACLLFLFGDNLTEQILVIAISLLVILAASLNWSVIVENFRSMTPKRFLWLPIVLATVGCCVCWLWIPGVEASTIHRILIAFSVTTIIGSGYMANSDYKTNFYISLTMSVIAFFMAEMISKEPITPDKYADFAACLPVVAALEIIATPILIRKGF